MAVVPACVEPFRLPARITITAFDAFGNRLKRGGDAFRIQVNQGPPITPEDQRDGTYTAALNLPIGVFRVDITLQGAPIHGNPFQIIVPYPFFNC